jgi:predicted nucleotidyltransferase
MSKRYQILKRVIGVVNEAAPDSELYLFGSQARGDASRNSDWDLLILLNTPQVSFSTETKVINDLYEIEVETGEVLSPLIYPIGEWNDKYSVTPLFENIHKEGIRIK